MPTAQQLTEILNAALQKLWEEDKDLFIDENGRNRKIHERTVVARLLHHLVCVSSVHQLPLKLRWDFEYNRQTRTNNNYPLPPIERKHIKSIPIEGTSLAFKHIFPDLILHERNTNNNCCVIEVKCTPSYSLNQKSLLKDYNTLIGMLHTHNYQYALSLILSQNSAYLTWFTTNKLEPTPITHITNNQTVPNCSRSNSLFMGITCCYCKELPICARKAIASVTID